MILRADNIVKYYGKFATQLRLRGRVLFGVYKTLKKRHRCGDGAVKKGQLGVILDTFVSAYVSITCLSRTCEET